ncbi:MAG: MFS transporter [Polyangiaceae bacterium]|nr:MFS transporter [Polyangiaceae bacterium]
MIQSPRAILALLTLLNFVNYLDRFLVIAVGPEIQKPNTGLGLDDGQIGWVTSAFMFGYFLTSPLFGRLGDQRARKHLIALGVAVWSLATVASGSASSFGTMIAARVFVGIGEASYATLSPTIIDDIAPPEKKNRYLAVFYLATPVGSALGFILGGQLQHHYGWRNAFYVAGGPGLLLAVIALLLVEPKRTFETRQGKSSSLETIAELWKRPAYVVAVLGYVAQTFALGGFVQWAPHYLERAHHMQLKDADFWLGGIAVLTGIAGTAAGGAWADRMKGDRVIVSLKICAVSGALTAPFAAACLFMPSPTLFFVFAALCELSLFLSVAPVNVAVMLSAPARLRASALAISIFMIHLLGDLISPPLIGEISKAAGGDAHALRLGMYLLPITFALSAIIWARGARIKHAVTEEPTAAGIS